MNVERVNVMPRYLIELPHEPSEQACRVAVETILTSGSHFLTHADWGCKDDVHKCWVIVEMETKDEARYILPPLYRKEAHIIELVQYSTDAIEEGIKNKQY